MCLRFDPIENTLNQTCSGTCKNKCGFKTDEDSVLAKSSLVKPRQVSVEKVTPTINKFQSAPYLNKNLYS